MRARVQHFEIKRKLNRAKIQSQLGSRYVLGADSQDSVERTYCDTFDWRLFRSGTTLATEPTNGRFECAWIDLRSGDAVVGAQVDAIPRFPAELPPGILRKKLAKLAKLRALLPLATVRVTVHTFPLLDREEKTVARLVVEHNRLTIENGSRRLPSYARIARLKGYGKAVERLRRALESCPGVRPARESLFEAALGALGQEPGRRGGVLPVLDPEMRADMATKSVLSAYLDILDENEAGVRDNIDTEFLHHFRVAVRRTRTLLRRVRGVFPASVVERFSADFKWLGDSTSPTRDLDVYLLEFDGYRKSILPAMRPDLEPLRDFLRRRHKEEHDKLVQTLGSKKYRSLIADWRAFLTAKPDRRAARKDPTGDDTSNEVANAGRPIVQVASEEIRRIYRNVLGEGRAIGPKTPAEPMHELRKDSKKLRYLIEAYQGVFPPAAVKRFGSVLKRLQDNLGTFNDLDVQSDALRGFATAMLDEGVSPHNLLAMGVLIGHLEERTRETRRQFADCFEQFARPKNTRFAKSVFRREAEIEGLGA